ncbi:hypothetical protein EJ04DRAFT_440465 [Polyplosphaeria fusca]|uniref:Asl1-like glycosyl hydrolase catalytic domain-containing protein n=1 Tax=Polyplosphaeria fusca TaxID=682080 RepID=A0A9P4QX07_9PLEO|nr:hypothetical protein EJ04DRAFT_440465 [Polyplosphaeria fusca]
MFSWMYNWGSNCQHGCDDAINLPFLPMLHDNQGGTVDWEANVDVAIRNGARHVFSFNEPDQCGGGGACMQDSEQTAQDHKKWIEPLTSKYPHVKFGAPAVTNGELSENNTAMGIPYLKKFLEHCDTCQIDFVVAHWYDAPENTAYFYKHLEDFYEAGGHRKVWLTEFGAKGDQAAQAKFLAEVLPWLDSKDWIERYAYHYAAPGFMITDDSNGLSPVGRVYAGVA